MRIVSEFETDRYGMQYELGWDARGAGLSVSSKNALVMAVLMRTRRITKYDRVLQFSLKHFIRLFLLLSLAFLLTESPSKEDASDAESSDISKRLSFDSEQ